MRVTVLASGSGGNSILVEAGKTRVLVDAGMAARELGKRLDRASTSTRLDDIQAVLVTHEHNDHASGVAALASAGVSIYATEGTARALNLPRAQAIAAAQKTSVGALEVLPVSLPHDAVEPVAFILSDGVTRVGVLTDCGHPTAEVAAAFATCDMLVLETNHDVDMLKGGGYPPSLKRRIGGRLGHLSNEQAGEMLRLMGRSSLRVLILAHLSQLNNRPRFARAAVDRALAGMGVRPRVLCAVQERPLSPVACEEGRIEILPAASERQLSLAFPE